MTSPLTSPASPDAPTAVQSTASTTTQHNPAAPVNGTSRWLCWWWQHGAAIRLVLLPTAFTTVCLLVWELAFVWFPVSRMVLSPPSEIMETLVRSLPLLLPHIASTAREAIGGFFLGAVAGIALGIAITQSHRVHQALFPNVVLFQIIPKVSLAPLFIIWLGVESESRLAFALFLSFFPIAVATTTGLSGTPTTALRLCAALTAGPWRTFHSVRLPFAIPSIFAGLKMGVTMALIGTIIGEFVTAQVGLGYIIMFASSGADSSLVFAALILLCTVGLLIYGCVTLAEKLAERWYGAPFVTEGFH